LKQEAENSKKLRYIWRSLNLYTFVGNDSTNSTNITKMKKLFAFALVAGMFFLHACGGGASNEDKAASQEEAEAEVTEMMDEGAAEEAPAEEAAPEEAPAEEAMEGGEEAPAEEAMEGGDEAPAEEAAEEEME